MGQPWSLLVAIVVLALLYVAFPVFLLTYSRFRAARRLLSSLLCPQAREQASVTLDAFHAGLTDAFAGRPRLRVKRCSLWPEREGCGQKCLAFSG
ncbi:MAG: hypothetical protein HYY54_01860 [candidate division NC10 bacterium]|nr:hypothetical protein [candidate division NC10 bacterium]MBI3002373.1 hypothetical protein [candidate division NC10 bacterium]